MITKLQYILYGRLRLYTTKLLFNGDSIILTFKNSQTATLCRFDTKIKNTYQSSWQLYAVMSKIDIKISTTTLVQCMGDSLL